MTRDLQELIDKARNIKMSVGEEELQRRSFAYGSAKIENNDITRDIIEQAALRLEKSTSDGR
jgi:Fic family protein